MDDKDLVDKLKDLEDDDSGSGSDLDEEEMK